MKKKSEVIIEEKVKKINKKNSLIETDNFEVNKTGSLGDDILDFNKVKNLEIENNEVPEIEFQEILIKDTGNYLNLKESFINIPVEMIVFPFFTPQKQNKRVNFKYTFQDLGVIMYSTLISKDKNDEVFQPSTFEEKIYMFLISLYLEKRNKGDKEAVIEFEISDFIVNFLGNKMNRAYYKKVEQALKNLKNTQYQFEISNHTKFGENKFEDKEFKLLTYQKLKSGKKIFYRVFLDRNIINKIKSKRYIKYNTKNLLEIMSKDAIASRIYQYISKIRYQNSEGEINVRTLAAIIPLKIEQTTFRKTKSGTKAYTLSRMKPVLIRLLKAFDVLMEMNYIKTYEEKFVREEDTYYVHYIFNKERDGDCHTSEFINKSKEKKIHKETFENEEIEIDLSEDIKYEETIEELVKKIKTNPKIHSKWNKRADNKINDIIKKDGEIILRRVLEILYNSNLEPSLTLVKSMNVILKTIRKSKKKGSMNLNLFENVNRGKGLKDKAQINQARKRYINKVGGSNIIKENNIESYMNKNKRIEDKSFKESKNNIKEKVKNNNENIIDIFNSYIELDRIEIEKEALEIFKKENETNERDMLVIKKVSEKTYYKILSNSIKKVIKKSKFLK